jgi:hypothetical protein
LAAAQGGQNRGEDDHACSPVFGVLLLFGYLASERMLIA